MQMIDKIRNRLSSFSVKMFLLILVCVVLPLSAASIYVGRSMESVLQGKISERIFQNLSRSEREILKMLENMAVFSNTFALDEEFLARIQDPSYSEFENVQYFNQIVDKMIVTSTDDLADSAKIIIFDQFGGCIPTGA